MGRRGRVAGGRGFEGGGWSCHREELQASAAMAIGGAATAAIWANESDRGGVDEREWQRREKRVRPGAPGGRPRRVHPGACAPRGGRALPVRHGGTARPAVVRGHGCGFAEEGRRARGLGRLRPADQKRGRGLLAPPFPFFNFFFPNIF